MRTIERTSGRQSGSAGERDPGEERIPLVARSSPAAFTIVPLTESLEQAKFLSAQPLIQNDRLMLNFQIIFDEFSVKPPVSNSSGTRVDGAFKRGVQMYWITALKFILKRH